MSTNTADPREMFQNADSEFGGNFEENVRILACRIVSCNGGFEFSKYYCITLHASWHQNQNSPRLYITGVIFFTSFIQKISNTEFCPVKVQHVDLLSRVAPEKVQLFLRQRVRCGQD